MKAEQRFDYVEKEIETAPIEIELEFVSPYMKGSTLYCGGQTQILMMDISCNAFFKVVQLTCNANIVKTSNLVFNKNKR